MKTHKGACHCGAITWEAQADITEVLECNCSHCSMKGFLLTFIPEEQFTLLSGEDNLSDYQFNEKKIHHLFCKTCGVQSFGRGTGPDGSVMIALNARCIPNLDMTNVQVIPIDGKSF